MGTVVKGSVSAGALLKRINRRLVKEDERVCRSRPRYYQGYVSYDDNTGEYYRIDVSRNFIIDKRLDLEELATELGVLGDGERLRKDG